MGGVLLLLNTAAHPTIMRHAHPHLGRLAVPADYGDVGATAAAGVPWAADNGAFGEFDPVAFERMIAAFPGVPGCLFVACPDVVAEAAPTLELFDEWEPRLRAVGQPVALVAQDGMKPGDVPWSRVDAIFVGGTDRFKLGPGGEAIVAAARARGLWRHMGRVNTPERVRYAATIGCQSFDGSSFSRWRKTWLPAGLRWAQAASQGRQERLL